MWTQIVGKIALAQAPPLNQSWAVALQLTPRGIVDAHAAARESHLHDGVRLSSIIRLMIRTLGRHGAAGRARAAIGRRFLRATSWRTMKAMELPVKIWPMARRDSSADSARHRRGAPYLRPGAGAPLLDDSVGGRARARRASRCDLRRQVQSGALLLGRVSTWRSPGFRDGRRRRARVPRSCAGGLFPGSHQPRLLVRQRSRARAGFLCVRRAGAAWTQGGARSRAAAFYHGELGEFILPRACASIRRHAIACRKPMISRDAHAIEPGVLGGCND